MPTPSIAFETPTATQLAELTHLMYAVSPGFPAIEVSSRYRTAIQIGDDGAEHRRLLRMRPERTIQMPIAALATEAVLATRSEMIRRSSSRYLAPLMSDLATLDAAASSGQTIISVSEDLDERRFQVGGRLAVFGTTNASEPAFEVAEIAAVTSSQLTVSSNLTESWLVGSWVVPLVEAELDLDTSGLFFYDETQQNETYVEVAGPATIDALVTPGTNPAGYTVYDSLPILDLECLRNRVVGYTTIRPGRIQSLGIGSRPATLGSRGAHSWDLGVQTQSRTEAWSLMSFFDSRGGEAYPFWFIDPADRLSRDFTFVSNNLVLPEQGLETDWALHRTHLVFTYDDDSYEVAVASHLGRASGVDSLSLTPNVTESGIRSVHILRKCRFQSEKIVEGWLTPTLCELDFSILELPDEADVAALFSTTSTTPITNTFDPDDFVSPPPIAFYATQKDTANNIHFAQEDGTAIAGGYEATGTITSGINFMAFRSDTVAAINGNGARLVIYNTISDTAATILPPSGHLFDGGSTSNHLIAMDADKNVYLASEETGGTSTPEIELHSYEPDGTHRWTTTVHTGSEPSITTGGYQCISNVLNNRVGIVVNRQDGSTFRRLMIYNATTGALVADNSIHDSAGTSLSVRTDGTNWFIDAQSSSSGWTDFPGGGEPAANVIAYTSAGSWVWGINIPNIKRIFYGLDGYLYFTKLRTNNWPGAAGQYASLLKIDKTTGIVVDHFDDATNFSSGTAAIDVDSTGRVIIGGDSNQRIAFLDADLDVIWSKPESDFFGSVNIPQVALQDGSI